MHAENTPENANLRHKSILKKCLIRVSVIIESIGILKSRKYQNRISWSADIITEVNLFYPKRTLTVHVSHEDFKQLILSTLGREYVEFNSTQVLSDEPVIVETGS